MYEWKCFPNKKEFKWETVKLAVHFLRINSRLFFREFCEYTIKQPTKKRAACMAIFINYLICKLHRDMKWAWLAWLAWLNTKELCSIKNQFQSNPSILDCGSWHWNGFGGIVCHCQRCVFVCVVLSVYRAGILYGNILLLSPEMNCHLTDALL